MSGRRPGRTQHLEALALVHGAFNLVAGLWPLVHLRSFEAVFGPKTDKWLVRTVAGLLATAGATQLVTPSDAAALEQTRRIGLGTAAVLGSIDLVYAPRGRISRMYLLDALAEGALVAAWLAAGRSSRGSRRPIRR
jgi:hypothetical protein